MIKNKHLTFFINVYRKTVKVLFMFLYKFICFFCYRKSYDETHLEKNKKKLWLKILIKFVFFETHLLQISLHLVFLLCQHIQTLGDFVSEYEFIFKFIRWRLKNNWSRHFWRYFSLLFYFPNNEYSVTVLGANSSEKL